MFNDQSPTVNPRFGPPDFHLHPPNIIFPSCAATALVFRPQFNSTPHEKIPKLRVEHKQTQDITSYTTVQPPQLLHEFPKKYSKK